MNITVERFQSIASAQIAAEGLTVIVGPSDRGKSALLRAIEAALFNRPGDQFVKRGQKTAAVTLTLAGNHSVQWEKGAGVNRYKVNGEDYSRVGTKAPQPLRDLGFKDVLIGARYDDAGKAEGGQWVRPQVARQFDKVFLLDESGPFLNEVLVGLSRLGVLQRAGRFCAADLRSAKSLAKLRAADLVTAEEDAEALAPIVPLRERLTVLAARVATYELAMGRVARLRGLLTERGPVEARVATVFPVQTVTNGKLQQEVQRARALRVLLDQRRVVQAALVTPLPRERKIKKSTATMGKKFLALAPLVSEQRIHRALVEQSETMVAQATERHAQLIDTLDDLKAQVQVCPVCERPF